MNKREGTGMTTGKVSIPELQDGAEWEWFALDNGMIIFELPIRCATCLDQGVIVVAHTCEECGGYFHAIACAKAIRKENVQEDGLKVAELLTKCPACARMELLKSLFGEPDAIIRVQNKDQLSFLDRQKKDDLVS